MAMQRVSLGTAVVAVLLTVAAQAQVGVAPTQQYPADRNPTNRADQNATAPVERMTLDKNAYKASEIMGLNIRSTNDENVGEVKDLRIESNGKIGYAVVSFGGFLGIGDKLFAVPFEALHIVKSGDNKLYAHLDVTEQTLKSKQGFDKDHWPEKADESFLTGATRQVGQIERPTAGANAPR